MGPISTYDFFSKLIRNQWHDWERLVSIAATAKGIYMVRSAYPIDIATIERRIRKGHLRYV